MSEFTVLGYPRSGGNLLRHIVQNLRGENIFDIIAANASDICIKTHEPDTIRQPTKVILIIRNYQDAIAGHMLRDLCKKTYNENTIIKLKDGVSRYAKQYFEVLEAFDKLDEPKGVVYYEDLIMYPYAVIDQLGLFMHCEDSIVDAFIENYKTHFDKLLGNYGDYHGKFSEGKNGFYEKNTSTDFTREVLDSFYDNHLYKKYLLRYEEGWREGV